MTHRPARPGRGSSMGWALAAAVGVGTAIGILGGVLSRTLVLDLLASWPVAVVVVVLAVAAVAFRRSRPSLRLVPGLLVLTWLVVALALHLAGPDWVPSSAADVIRRSPILEPRARIAVELPGGSLDVAAAESPGGYSVVPMRLGGSVGPPEVLEQSGAEQLSVLAVTRDDTRWFRFRGWEVRLSSEPEWEVELSAEDVAADFTALDVGAARLGGQGHLLLGPPGPDGSTLHLSGRWEVVFPVASPVEVRGPLDRAPDGWVPGDGVWRAPVDGTGWTVELAPDAVVAVDPP